MSKVDDKHIGVARVYSRSLLELAEKRGVADDVLDELGEIARHADGDPRFASFISSPLVDPDDRAKALETMFRGKVQDVLVDALQVMNRKGRLEILPTMAESFREEHAVLRGRLEVHVYSAIELTDALRDRLTKSIAEQTGQQVELIEEVDETMIGGIVVRIGDRKYDGSVSRHIQILHEIFHERARQHIYQSRRDQAEAG